MSVKLFNSYMRKCKELGREPKLEEVLSLKTLTLEQFYLKWNLKIK